MKLPQLSQQEEDGLKRLFEDIFGSKRGIHILEDPESVEMTVEEAHLLLDRMVEWSSKLARKRKLALGQRKLRWRMFSPGLWHTRNR